jgi:hypothetical protein
MTPRNPERRSSQRHALKIPLAIRAWGTSSPAQRAESVDLSARGLLMETDAELGIGALLELRLSFPEEIMGQPSVEWRCRGRVVRSASNHIPGGRPRVGLHFDSLDILR